MNTHNTNAASDPLQLARSLHRYRLGFWVVVSGAVGLLLGGASSAARVQPTEDHVVSITTGHDNNGRPVVYRAWSSGKVEHRDAPLAPDFQKRLWTEVR